MVQSPEQNILQTIFQPQTGKEGFSTENTDMIKSTIKSSTYAAMYRLLDMVSPVDSDCGLLCGSICCSDPDNSALLGMQLLPGEDKIHNKKDSWLQWDTDEAEDLDYPESWKGKVFFVKCNGPSKCKRYLRPIQCRTYPLMPYINSDNRLTLALNAFNVPYICPLKDGDEVVPLNESFIRATYTVWKRLITDPLIFDLVKMDSNDFDFNGINVRIVYCGDTVYGNN